MWLRVVGDPERGTALERVPKNSGRGSVRQLAGLGDGGRGNSGRTLAAKIPVAGGRETNVCCVPQVRLGLILAVFS